MSTEAIETDALAEIEGDEAPVVEAPQVDPETEAEARKYGWKPESEWKGDPPKYGFVSADDYLENPRVLSARLQDRLDDAERQREADKRDFQQRLDRQESVYREAEKRRAENHAREMERLKADQRKAAEEMDMDRFDAVTRQMDDLGPVPDAPAEDSKPEVPAEEMAAVNAWRADPANAWFHTDRRMAEDAMQYYSDAAASGISDGAGRLAYMQDRMGERYASLAPKPAPRRAASVDGGGLAGRTVSAVSKLPPEAREAMAMFIEDGTFKSEEDYAKAYFAENGDG